MMQFSAGLLRLLCCCTAFGQSAMGRMTGIIIDSSGVVAPSCKIAILNPGGLDTAAFNIGLVASAVRTRQVQIGL
jgi:hypothetical protein